MICEVREGKEVILRNAKFSDIFAVIQIWLHKDMEICYTNPIENEPKIEFHKERIGE